MTLYTLNSTYSAWNQNDFLTNFLYNQCSSLSGLNASACTCVNTQQPGADERSECLARLGQQGNHPEEEGRRRLLASVDHEVLVHQIGNDQLQQLARSLSKHPVTAGKTDWSVRTNISNFISQTGNFSQ